MPSIVSSRRFHIVIDAIFVSSEKVNSKDFVYQLIKDICCKIEMNFLTQPLVVEGNPDNPGITGFAIIDFSHIAVHTFSKTNEVCVDIFSCKEFDYKVLYKIVKQALKVKDRYISRAVVEYNNKPIL